MTRFSRVVDSSVASRVPQLRHDLHTFQDAVERILLKFDAERDNLQALHMARLAVVDAYRDLPNLNIWSYYNRTSQIVTEASYGTGTIAYDHTGGAHERLVTLTSGTWPANAALGTIKVSARYYPVEKRVSDTLVVLSANNNPGADIASGTTYTWFRDTYGLPLDYRSSGKVVDTTDSLYYPLDYVNPDDALVLMRSYSGPQSRAQWWTIRNDGRFLNGMSILFVPQLSAARNFEFVYHAEGQRLHTEKYSEGTVTTTAGSTSVSGTSTAFLADHQGSVIRFSRNATDEPTSAAGYYDPAGENYNPYVEEGVIHTVTNGTAIVLGDAARQTLSAVKFTVSDPIDIDVQVMYSALVALADFNYARLTKHKNLNDYAAMFANDLRLAKEADYRPLTTKHEITIRSMIGDVDGAP